MEAHIRLLEAQSHIQSVLADAVQLAARALESAVLPRLQAIANNPDLAYEKLEKQILLERLFEDITAAVQLSTACTKNIEEFHKLKERLGMVQSSDEYTKAIYELLYGPQTS